MGGTGGVFAEQASSRMIGTCLFISGCFLARCIKFIIPLPRDDARIDYGKEHSKVFEYHGGIIKCTSYYVRPHWVYHYEDQKLKYTEITQYYKLKLKKGG